MSRAFVQSLSRRWHALDRGERVALVGITSLVAGAVAVRAWFMVTYRPAFLGFEDSHEYVRAAVLGIFRDAQHPAGYPLFLRLVHHLGDNLSLTIVVQHVIGVATGLLLYKAVRRTGAPPWLGLLPAAIVFFGGTGLFLEHALLADSLLAFLQAIGVYATIRALYDAQFRWPLLAGVAIGLAFWVKTVAISTAILLPPLLLFAAAGATRRRLLSALTASIALLALLFAYVAAQDISTGYLGYERQSAWNLYGRVATFVDCSKFTPPRGTGFLCPSEPLAHRQTPSFYQYAAAAPAVKRFGGPSLAPPSANALLESFSVAAIEQEPIAYAEAIVRSLGRYVFPQANEGYTPDEIRQALVDPAKEKAIQLAIARLYPHSVGFSAPTASIHPLSVYERHTRVQGPLLVFLLLTAIAAPFVLPARMRPAAIAFTLTALLSITFAAAGNSYDARYAYPTFGPLAAAGALGTWGLASLLARAISVRGIRARGLAPAPSQESSADC